MIAQTSFKEIFPDGISRPAVLGFLASISLSIRLFNAIAALLAPRKESPTQNNIRSSGTPPLAMKAPRYANGMANTVCLSTTKSEYNLILDSITTLFSDHRYYSPDTND